MKLLHRKAKYLMVLACILYAGNSVMIAVQVYINSKIVEYASLGNMDSMLRCVLLAGSAAILIYILSGVATYTRLSYLANGELGIKSDIMKNILQRPVKSFRGEDDAFYLNLLSTDVSMYCSDYLNMIPFLFSSVAAIVSSVFMLWKLHPWLLLAGMVMAVIPTTVIKPIAKLEQKCKVEYSKANQVYTGALKENIEGYETIRAGCSESNFHKKYDNAGILRQRALAQYNFVNTMSFQTLMSLAGLSNIVCLGIGGFIVVKGWMNVGMLFAAANYITSLSNSFTNITDNIISMRSTKSVADKLQSQRQIPCLESKVLLENTPAEINYENITFSFGDRQIYKQFSFHFAPGGCYVIVGESGSGKSTLIKLLLKYFDDYEGTIYLAGQDIRGLSEEDIYSRVGVVNQAPYIFNASFYENITLNSGYPKQDSEDYKSLLKELNLTSLAEYVGDVPLGDFGDRISGGERQRISIARVMRRKPSIIIFDEPTTGLDPENVELIDNFIFQLKDITRIVISHNWSKEYLNQFDDVIRL